MWQNCNQHCHRAKQIDKTTKIIDGEGEINIQR